MILVPGTCTVGLSHGMLGTRMIPDLSTRTAPCYRHVPLLVSHAGQVEVSPYRIPGTDVRGSRWASKTAANVSISI